jgi:hypothetical protein
LAESPLDFSGSGSVGHSMLGFNNPYAMTNKGLHITLPMAKLEGNYHVALLHCMISQDHVVIVLKEFPGDRYFRVALNSLKFQESISSLPLLKWDATRKTIYVPNVLPLVEFMDFALEEYPQISIYGSSAKVVSYHYDNFSVHY